MDPEDKKIDFDIDVTEYTPYGESSVIDIGNITPYTIQINRDDSFDWVTVDTSSSYDNSYGILPVQNNPEVYTCHEQREKHEKYPALKKAWEDYLNMYNLTQGDPPIVE